MKPVSRRDFIKNTSGAGVALWLGISLAKGEVVNVLAPAEDKTITPFILVDTKGGITIFNPKPEMGQGTFQSIPALICEELEVTLEQVTIKNTNGEKKYGPIQWVGGSTAVKTSYDQMRKVGAAAREMFIKAASTKWGVEPASCRAEGGTVIHTPTKRTLTYSDLAEAASKLDVPKEPKLKDSKDFTLIGKSIKRPDIPAKVTGKAPYALDFKVPGMVYASVERCPVIGGTLKSVDDSQALKVPGVQKVVKAERIVGKYNPVGVAVIANSYWAAVQGRKALKIDWDTKGFETFSSAAYDEKLRSMVAQEGLPDKNVGSIEAAGLMPERTLEALYETPMVAHNAMEPLSCVAHVQGDKLQIWTSTQVPGSVVGDGPGDMPKLVGFAPSNITLHNTFIGGGFGRKLMSDYIIEAVNVAKQINKPVKVVWTREDTLQYGPYRPMTFSWLKGGVSADGKLLAFQHKVISPSYGESMSSTYDKTKVDRIMVEGIGEQPYEIPNLNTSYVRADYHVPMAAWRSVTSSTVAFAHECFIDELAHKAGKDPLAFRLAMLTKDSDVKKVLLKLKEVSNWDKPLPKGKGRGIAQWDFFAGLCGQVVEVSKQKDGSVKVDKVYAVIDLGQVVNPDTVKAQIESAVAMALGAATKPGITLEGGKVVQSNFHDHPTIRINEMPTVEVHILTGEGPMKGVGEPGLPPLAPALGNAIFAATGKRVRKLPVDLANIG